MENTGDVAGAEVVQVYVGGADAATVENAKNLVSLEDRPIKQLKGFSRVEVASGDKKQVTIEIPVNELCFWTPNGWVLDESYNVFVGTDAMNAQCVAKINLLR